MDLTPDPILDELRRALRAGLSGVPALDGVHGAPVVDGPTGPTRAILDALGADGFERPAAAGGLDLGLTAGVLVSEELGRAARGNSYRADALAADLGGPAGASLAGFETLSVGAGVTAMGRELIGTATADATDPGTLLVATRVDDAPVLVAVAPDAPGRRTETDCWPVVVRLDVTPAEMIGALDDATLARARLRQAAYLLGIAAGAHDIAVGYAGVRTQFGSRLRDLPAVSFPLARSVVDLNATRAAVYRAAWLADWQPDSVGTAPVEALALAAETARKVVRSSMQSCGVRAMTAELGLHRHFRLVAAEATRYGDPAALWRLVGAERLAGRLGKRSAGARVTRGVGLVAAGGVLVDR